MDAVKPKRSLVEETYNILVDAICTGELASGERLHQDEIAGRLNVSRQPVNSAISILRANGLVEDTGRRSVIVTQFDPNLFRGIYEYRRVIEPFAVRLAGRSLNHGHLRQANRVLKAGRLAIEGGKLSELLRADALFHEMIYSWSGNQVVETSMRTNWHHIRRSMAEVLRDITDVMPVWAEHNEIVEKLFAGQTEEAAQIMENHIEHAYRAILGSVVVLQK